jgi:hypothetical protein
MDIQIKPVILSGFKANHPGEPGSCPKTGREESQS